MSQKRRQGRHSRKEDAGPVSGESRPGQSLHCGMVPASGPIVHPPTLQEVDPKSTRGPLTTPSTQSRGERQTGAPPHLAAFLATLFTIAILICLAALCLRAMRVADNVAELIALAIAAAVLGAGALWVLSRDEAS